MAMMTRVAAAISLALPLGERRAAGFESGAFFGLSGWCGWSDISHISARMQQRKPLGRARSVPQAVRPFGRGDKLHESH